MWAGTDPATVKAVWAQDLAGVTAEQLRSALEACKQLDWPPSLPEFLKLCCPPPDYEATFFRAISEVSKPPLDRHWPDKVTFWAALNFGFTDLKGATYSAAKERWKSCVDAAVKEPDLPDIPAPSPELPPPVPEREWASSAVAAARAILNTKRDRHDWARKILERWEAGEALPAISLVRACAALKIDVPERPKANATEAPATPEHAGQVDF